MFELSTCISAVFITQTTSREGTFFVGDIEYSLHACALAGEWEFVIKIMCLGHKILMQRWKFYENCDCI